MLNDFFPNKKQATVPHPFRIFLRNGWETKNL